MQVSYTTAVIGEGNHASLHIPDEVLAQLGVHKRAPLKITVNGYTYQSTATGVGGECRVVFPQRDRAAAGATAGDVIEVTLELDAGHREVELPDALSEALTSTGLRAAFEAQRYSQRKEWARTVAEAKTPATREKRIALILAMCGHDELL
jgi:bifunctional DNA-binding transcriptional regulator/antitoxin component of YhaV-PrlF toxin-antitoxin module